MSERDKFPFERQRQSPLDELRAKQRAQVAAILFGPGVWTPCFRQALIEVIQDAPGPALPLSKPHERLTDDREK